MKKWILKAFMLFFVPLACAVTELDDPRKGRSASNNKVKNQPIPTSKKELQKTKEVKHSEHWIFIKKNIIPMWIKIRMLKDFINLRMINIIEIGIFSRF